MTATTATSTRANQNLLQPGMPVIYRHNGTGQPHAATVLTRGPQGQFRVSLDEAPGAFGACPHCELFL